MRSVKNQRFALFVLAALQTHGSRQFGHRIPNHPKNIPVQQNPSPLKANSIATDSGNSRKVNATNIEAKPSRAIQNAARAFHHCPLRLITEVSNIVFPDVAPRAVAGWGGCCRTSLGATSRLKKWLELYPDSICTRLDGRHEFLR